MPAAFEACIKKGGKVRTKTLKGGRYQYICFYKGKSYAGEVHKKKGDGLKHALRGKNGPSS